MDNILLQVSSVATTATAVTLGAASTALHAVASAATRAANAVDLTQAALLERANGAPASLISPIVYNDNWTDRELPLNAASDEQDIVEELTLSFDAPIEVPQVVTQELEEPIPTVHAPFAAELNDELLIDVPL